jgi:hypothetical protein
MNDKAYKIRRKSDGLFSSGGTDPDFNRQGKTWSCIGHLKNHLKQFYSYHWQTKGGDWRLEMYKDCEIVEYEIIETIKPFLTVKEFIKESYGEII